MWKRSLVLALTALAGVPTAAQATQPGRNGLLAAAFTDNLESPSATGARPNPLRYGYLGLAGGAAPARPFAWCEFRRTDPPPCRRFGTVEFSPDGTQLADAGLTHGMHIRSLDGAIVREVTTLPAESPTWSPDGSRIAFLTASDVFTIRTDGTGLRRLTRTESGSTAGTPKSVSWSSRGRLAAAFVRGERTSVVTMRPDGRGARVIKQLRGELPTVDWTPDARRLLVSGGRIVLVDTRGRRRARVLRRDGFAARISPDGKRIAFYPYEPTVVDNKLMVARANGRAAREVSLVDSETGYPNEGSFEYLREAGPLSWQPLP